MSKQWRYGQRSNRRRLSVELPVIDTDYDILPLPSGDGELFLSKWRSASYKPDGNGHVLIHLEHIDGTACDGWQNQSDKARDICRVWVESGHVSETLNQLPEDTDDDHE